jgi:hypothetical protein
MTAYDDWKTTKQEIDDEAWEDAVEHVAKEVGGSLNTSVEVVSTIANADDVLTWLSHAVEVPQHHLHAFRDLIKLASGLRKEVETERKATRS